MSDERLRELERRARAGDLEAAGELAVARVRAGVGNAVERAHAVLVSGDPDAALEHLLARWRELPAPALADAIDRLTERVAKERGAVAGKTRAALISAALAPTARPGSSRSSGGPPAEGDRTQLDPRASRTPGGGPRPPRPSQWLVHHLNPPPRAIVSPARRFAPPRHDLGPGTGGAIRTP